MKRKIRLTESKLKNIISESLKRILSESVWYGNTEPFETIIKACQQIKDSFNYVNDDDYEDMSDDNSGIEYGIYKWADRIENEANSFIESEAHNIPIKDY